MNESVPNKGKALNQRALVLIALHVLLLIYSLVSFFSKSAAQYEFLSLPFIGFYIGMLAMLGIYAVGWQQVIKYLPLTLAFANKAVTVIWGILWGWLFFGEQVTPIMLLGAAIVMAGVVMFGLEDAKEQQSHDVATDQKAQDTQ